MGSLIPNALTVLPGHIPGGGGAFLREGGPISYQPRPSASLTSPPLLRSLVEEISGVALVAVNLETNEIKHCSKVRVCFPITCAARGFTTVSPDPLD